MRSPGPVGAPRSARARRGSGRATTAARRLRPAGHADEGQGQHREARARTRRPRSRRTSTRRKPHWGVIELDGAIVEREAFSLTRRRAAPSCASSSSGCARSRRTTSSRACSSASTRSRSACPMSPSCAPRCTTSATPASSCCCHTESATQRDVPRARRVRHDRLAPLGDIAITGPSAMPVHVKPLLDKLGVAGRLHPRRRVQGRRRAADARRAVARRWRRRSARSSIAATRRWSTIDRERAQARPGDGQGADRHRAVPRRRRRRRRKLVDDVDAVRGVPRRGANGAVDEARARPRQEGPAAAR